MSSTLTRVYRAAMRLPVLNRMAPKLDLVTTYPRELLLLNGLHKPSSDRPSIVFFTVHKAASVYVARIMKDLAKESGLTLIDFAGYRFKGGKTKGTVFEPGDLARKVYQPKGYFYGPFRNYNPAIENLDQYRIVLNLRDPRDVLVSAYFSMAFSHYVPDKENPEAAKKILAGREATLGSDIDQWVLEAAPNIQRTFADLCNNLLDKPNVCLARYERLVTDFDGWLAEIVKFLDFQPSAALVEGFRKGANFDVKEDVKKHKRQVTPGDHARKLKPETIEKLNTLLGDVLTRLQYPLHV